MTEAYEMIPEDEWAALRRLTALSASVTDRIDGWTTDVSASLTGVTIRLKYQKEAPTVQTGFDLERVMGTSPAVLGWAAEKLAAAERDLEATRLLVRELLTGGADHLSYVDLDAGVVDTRPTLTPEQVALARHLMCDHEFGTDGDLVSCETCGIRNPVLG